MNFADWWEGRNHSKILVKRSFDLLIGAPSLVLLSPLILGIALAVRLSMGKPVLFRQARPGLNGKLFELYKFRTMTVPSDGTETPNNDAERLTRVGRFLRETSLDELPELVNVVKGEMSLVGPRPLLPQYLERYTHEQARRHEMKPGITGWAQVNGRNAVRWDKRLELDVWYVDNWTLRLDIRILIATMRKVLSGEGVTVNGHATVPEFQGDQATDQ